MTYKTTLKDEDYFAGRVRHWLRFFSLGDWKVEVYRKKLTDMSAACEFWKDSQGAHIMLNEELAYRPSKTWLNRIALHEVGHILLYHMKQLIYNRVVTDGMADTAEHAVIRRLESALAAAMDSTARDK